MQNNSGAFVRNEKNALAKNEKGIQFPFLPSPPLVQRASNLRQTRGRTIFLTPPSSQGKKLTEMMAVGDENLGK